MFPSRSKRNSQAGRRIIAYRQINKYLQMKRTLIVISVSLLLSFLPSSLQLNCIFAREAPAAWSERVARNFISRYPDPDVIHWNGQSNHFTWQAGYIMFAMAKLWRQTNDSTYFNYIRRYVDQNVDSEGNVPNFTPSPLDNFRPGYACLLMYEQTGEQRYARAAETSRRGFDTYPRMDDGAAGPASGEVAGWMFHHSKRSEEHTSELQSPDHLVCRLLLEKK